MTEEVQNRWFNPTKTGPSASTFPRWKIASQFLPGEGSSNPKNVKAGRGLSVTLNSAQLSDRQSPWQAAGFQYDLRADQMFKCCILSDPIGKQSIIKSNIFKHLQTIYSSLIRVAGYHVTIRPFDDSNGSDPVSPLAGFQAIACWEQNTTCVNDVDVKNVDVPATRGGYIHWSIEIHVYSLARYRLFGSIPILGEVPHLWHKHT